MILNQNFYRKFTYMLKLLNEHIEKIRLVKNANNIITKQLKK